MATDQRVRARQHRGHREVGMKNRNTIASGFIRDPPGSSSYGCDPDHQQRLDCAGVQLHLRPRGARMSGSRTVLGKYTRTAERQDRHQPDCHGLFGVDLRERSQQPRSAMEHVFEQSKSCARISPVASTRVRMRVDAGRTARLRRHAALGQPPVIGTRNRGGRRTCATRALNKRRSPVGATGRGRAGHRDR